MLPIEFQKRTNDLWQNFWPGSALKPLSVLDFLTNLLYLKKVDQSSDLLREAPEASTTGTSEDSAINLIWQNLRLLNEEALYHHYIRQDGLLERVNKLLQTDPAFFNIAPISDALIPTSALLYKSFKLIDDIDSDPSITAGDFYSYLLTKLSANGISASYSTEPALVALLGQIINPSPGEKVVNINAGAAGFLVHVANHIQLRSEKYRSYKNVFSTVASNQLIAIDGDAVVAKIGIMNLMINGINGFEYKVDNPLSRGAADAIRAADVILAHIPLAEFITFDNAEPSLISHVGTMKKSSVLLHRILSLIRPGARAAVIVPDEVLSGTSAQQQEIRKDLVESNILEAVIKLEQGTESTNANGLQHALFFRKSSTVRTDNVWFYDVNLALPAIRSGTDAVNRTNEALETSVYPAISATWNNNFQDPSGGYSGNLFTVDELRNNNYSLDPATFKTHTSVVDQQTYHADHKDYAPYPERKKRRKYAGLVAGIIALSLIAGGYFFFNRPITSLGSAAPATKKDSMHVQGYPLDSASSSVKVSEIETKEENTPPKPTSTPGNEPKASTKESAKEEEGSTASKGKYKILSKAYFHNEPDEDTRRNAYVVHWNNTYATLNALDEANGFVYVEFKNHLGQTSKGWLKKKDLKPVE